MDNSNPELQQISDSQVLGSTRSLSLPSEPPDIRNWFPSYEYESPVLDSNYNFGDSVSKGIQFAKSELVMEESGGEKEENPGGLKKIRKRDEEFVVEKLWSNGFAKCSSFLGSDKLADSCHSPSLLSEPPDIRNWFASYVYESPALDTSDYFVDSLSEKSECKYDGFVNEESKIETGENVGENVHSDGIVKCNNSFGNNVQKRQSSIELADSCHSPSLLSEPPDIRNWFASFVYESPALDTSDYFVDSLSKKSECKYDGVVNEETKIETGENVGENVHSDGVVKCNNSFGNNVQKQQSSRELAYSCHSPSLLSEPPDIRNWFASYVYESPALDTSDYYFGDSLSKENECEYDGFVNEERKIEIGENVGENVHSDGVIKCNDSFGNNVEKQHSSREGDDGVGGKENPSAQIKSTFGRPSKQTLKFEIFQNDAVPTKDVSALIQCKLQKPQENSCMMAVNIRKTSGCDDSKSLESEGKDGFVTTRNNSSSFTRINNENFLRSKRRVPLGGGGVERKVLAETTNFQYSDAMEVAGKWRCPQKSKPNLGPPLKQLRLEQWIHRM